MIGEVLDPQSHEFANRVGIFFKRAAFIPRIFGVEFDPALGLGGFHCLLEWSGWGFKSNDKSTWTKDREDVGPHVTVGAYYDLHDVDDEAEPSSAAEVQGTASSEDKYFVPLRLACESKLLGV